MPSKTAASLNNSIRQFRILMWKNYILKQRCYISTVVEICIPIVIVLILMQIRRLNLKIDYNYCAINERRLDSMNPVLFIRDFLCTLSSTCYSDREKNGNNMDLINFLNNFSSVYNSFPDSNSMTLDSLSNWITSHPIEAEKFKYSVAYFTNSTAIMFQYLSMIQSDNELMFLGGLLGLSKFLCGSDNMVEMLLVAFQSTSSRKPRSSSSCQLSLRQFLQYRFYNQFSDMIFGKIYYTPKSNFTDKLIFNANRSFVILDKLRLASVQWRLHFGKWFETDFISKTDNFRNVLKQCTLSQCLEMTNQLNVINIRMALKSLHMVFGRIEKLLNCTELNKFVPMPSEESIANLKKEFTDFTFAGLVFDPSTKYLTRKNATFLNYSIRIPSYRIFKTKNFVVFENFWRPKIRLNTFFELKYYSSGFLMLQEAIDHSFIEIVTGKSVDRGSSIQIMPGPCYTDDMFIKISGGLLPFLLLMSWSPFFSLLIKRVVYEKENRLKEFMLIMGLSHSVHWLAWFSIAIATAIIPIFFVTLFLKLGKILEFGSMLVVFIFLFSFMVSLICQAFMVSAFFNHANQAAVASALIYFVFYMPYIILTKLEDSVTYIAYALVGIFTQVTFCNGIYFMALLEEGRDGIQFSNMFEASVSNVNYCVGHCIVTFWIDSLIYIIITFYVEAVFPGEFGIPKKWYFLCTKKYWISNNHANIVTNREMEKTANNFAVESVPSHLEVGISIQNLTKHFPVNKVPSVDNLNLDFYKSHITAFLGHNGAGKTTTISILTGIFQPTSGTAFIMNCDIRTDMDRIRNFLGLCPQHNILFDYLTVSNHIYFYGLLKGLTKQEVNLILPKIIDDVGLKQKINIQSSQLSGGMKRKLSVAMAFIGDSKVVFLDEPTAGVDPFARRGIWDLLIKYRKPDSTIILTTHHMDEADYLSDRIAIISEGKLKCCGSSTFLKKQYGNGYNLTLVKSPNVQNEDFSATRFSTSTKNVLLFVQKHIPNAKMHAENKSQCTLILPLDGLQNNGFSKFFQSLDISLSSLNFVSYGLSDTTLEDVFLKIAEDPSQFNSHNKKDDHSDDKLTANPRRKPLLTGIPLLRQQMAALQIKRFNYTKRDLKGLFFELILPISIIVLTVILVKFVNPMGDDPLMVISPWLMMSNTNKINLHTFFSNEDSSNLNGNQLVNMYKSDIGQSGPRCMNRSVFVLMNYVCYSVPGTWINTQNEKPLSSTKECVCKRSDYPTCSNPKSGTPENSYRLMKSSDTLHDLTGYNISNYLLKKFKFYMRKQFGGLQLPLVSQFGLSCQIIETMTIWNNWRTALETSNKQAIHFVDDFHEFFRLSGLRINYTRIWVNTRGYVSMPAYINIHSNLLLRAQLKSGENLANYGISVATQPFQYTKVDAMKQMKKQMRLELSLSQFVILAMSLIPASFLIFLISERVSGAKRQQFVTGINPCVYWLSNFFWDIIKYGISATLVLLIFVLFKYDSFVGSKNVAAFVSLLCGYGFAIITHFYPFSYVISVPSTAFVVVSMYSMLIGCVSTISTFMLDQMQVAHPHLNATNDALKRFFIIFPQYCLGRGMMDLSMNFMQFNLSNGKKDYNALDLDVCGKYVIALVLIFVFWSAVLTIIESGIVDRTLYGRIKKYAYDTNVIVGNEDEDVLMERKRIHSKTDDILKVVDLTKVYYSLFAFAKKSADNSIDSETRKVAVNNICFGVKPGECFGLLGVNGAGKTTTFKMLTGEELITKGNVMINDKSVINNIVGAHRNMGFCPQFDALHDSLTCEEELYLYCRIRGIELSLLKITVDSYLKDLSLDPHAKKTTQTLSGGNKRKLSTAIALIGHPSIVFMDEPTSGMDAGARRFLWKRIQEVTSNGESVILTSHNMEECEILCDRLAIMVAGTFKCLGSVQQLKSKFGDHYFVTLRLQFDCDETGQRQVIKNLMQQKFENGLLLKDENFVSIQYRINPSEHKLSMIFEFFENLKNIGSIIDYSISQTTLDEIFIEFARRNIVVNDYKGENYNNYVQIYSNSFVNLFPV